MIDSKSEHHDRHVRGHIRPKHRTGLILLTPNLTLPESIRYCSLILHSFTVKILTFDLEILKERRSRTPSCTWPFLRKTGPLYRAEPIDDSCFVHVTSVLASRGYGISERRRIVLLSAFSELHRSVRTGRGSPLGHHSSEGLITQIHASVYETLRSDLSAVCRVYSNLKRCDAAEVGNVCWPVLQVEPKILNCTGPSCL